ncbi:MAG: GtrA family protein [Magnetospiraceae bacterium]
MCFFWLVPLIGSVDTRGKADMDGPEPLDILGDIPTNSASKQPHFPQWFAPLAKFGLVGGVATLVHVGGYALFIEELAMRALLANFLAYSIAFGVGFTGHYLWSFRAQTKASAAGWRRAMVKYFIVSLVGLALNTIQVWLIVDIFTLHYGVSILAMVTVTPGAIFLMSRFWAFR